ncbi:polysialyltransferase family glycosyltransferase [Shewanella woodyi]|uniref:polysialyltransferase family glycosyltransferase n=1 Tax=Shewanella woodyi TaxID=60961 RepID=UPI0007EAD4E0|nr:polysialyltransferase family glycosyltransferase [Shewanella woodyi]
MIYLVVNNDFHIDIFMNLLPDFTDFDVCVVTIPYNLNKKFNLISNNIINIHSPYIDRKKFLNPFSFRSVKQEAAKIRFDSNDVVIFLTEYDPVNQYIVFLAKEKGAKTILLEEGISTYYNNIILPGKRGGVKTIIKSLYIKYIIGFHFIEVKKSGGFLFLKLKDHYLDKLVLFRDISLNRNIEIEVVNSRSPAYSGLDPKGCLFLNQPIYQSYLGKEEYLEAMTQIVSQLSNQFDVVYFKFHPRDTKPIKDKVGEILSHCSNFIIVPEEFDITEAVNTYKSLYAVSFFSDALFKLSLSGVKIVFLYHLLPKLKHHTVLKSLTKVLWLMKYYPAPSFDRLTENNYCESLLSTKKNLSDVIRELKT